MATALARAFPREKAQTPVWAVLLLGEGEVTLASNPLHAVVIAGIGDYPILASTDSDIAPADLCSCRHITFFGGFNGAFESSVFIIDPLLRVSVRNGITAGAEFHTLRPKIFISPRFSSSLRFPPNVYQFADMRPGCAFKRSHPLICISFERSKQAAAHRIGFYGGSRKKTGTQQWQERNL